MSKDRHFGIADTLDCALSSSLDDNAFDHRGVVRSAASDLDHPHIVYIEVVGVLGADVDAGLRYERAEQVLKAILFAGH